MTNLQYFCTSINNSRLHVTKCIWSTSIKKLTYHCHCHL